MVPNLISGIITASGSVYDDFARADVALRGVAGKRLTYETTRRQIALETPPF
jgi:hypothetical protein